MRIRTSQFISHFNSFVLIILLTILNAFTVIADDGITSKITPNFCLPEEKYAPDGIIQKVGKRYYRMCRRSEANGIASNSIQLLAINPAAIEGLIKKDTLLTLHIDPRYSYDRSYINYVNLLYRSKSGSLTDGRRGIRTFGNYEYISNYFSRNLGKNGKPGLGIYIPKTEYIINNKLHQHNLSCVGESQLKNKKFSCFLKVPYQDISTRVAFFFLDEVSNPIPEYDLVFYVEDVNRILKQIDVTDELDKWRGVVEIFE